MNNKTVVAMTLILGCNAGEVESGDLQFTDTEVGFGDTNDTGDTGETNAHQCWNGGAPATAVRWQCEGLAEAAIFATLNVEVPDLLAAPMFETRWRWNASRALVVPRMKGGKKVPPHMQRFKADDFLGAVFPAKTGCFENHHGDIDVPDHPLVRQTLVDCLTEAMDGDGSQRR